jgi:hypothetical protein
VTKTEEDDIYLVERHLIGEAEVSVAQQTFVNVAHAVTRIRLRVGKHNLHLWVVNQQTQQFAACISGSTKDSDFNHNYILKELTGN